MARNGVVARECALVCVRWLSGGSYFEMMDCPTVATNTAYFVLQRNTIDDRQKPVPSRWCASQLGQGSSITVLSGRPRNLLLLRFARGYTHPVHLLAVPNPPIVPLLEGVFNGLGDGC
ncbi:unnamed protein product, partial [Discosporangium mesarthrocarpum]